MYAADVPFLEKWRTAMGYMDEDLAAGLSQDWAELQAAAMNDADLQRRFRAVYATWRSVLTEAFVAAAREYGVSDAAVPALVTLVMTFTVGMFNERLVGVDTGHAELLAWFEGDDPCDGAGAMTAASPGSRRGPGIPTTRAISTGTECASTGSATAMASARSSSCRRGRSCTRGAGRPRSRTSPAATA